MFVMLGLGEALWDVFHDRKVLGGAPCNFAYHVKALGHEGVPLSRVGRDKRGHELLGALRALGLRTDLIQSDAVHATGEVLVTLDGQGVPDFTVVEDVAWDYMEPEAAWIAAARQADAVCFGTLAQRSPGSRLAIARVLDAAEQSVLIYDVNFRQQFYSRQIVRESLARTTVLKLNELEVDQMRELLGRSDGEAEFLRGIMDEFDVALTCVTLGPKGCTLYSREHTVSRGAPAVSVADTVGSGDAFAAALAVKYLQGCPLESIAEGANLLGAYVAGRHGATPRLSAEVIDKFHSM